MDLQKVKEALILQRKTIQLFAKVLSDVCPMPKEAGEQLEVIEQIFQVAIAELEKPVKVKCDACSGLSCGDECDGHSHFTKSSPETYGEMILPAHLSPIDLSHAKNSSEAIR